MQGSFGEFAQAHANPVEIPLPWTLLTCERARNGKLQ